MSASKAYEGWARKRGLSTWWGLEPHADRNAYHVHALIRSWRYCGPNLSDDWEDRYGYATIRRYDYRRGARFYLGKYVCKGLSWWNIMLLPQPVIA